MNYIFYVLMIFVLSFLCSCGEDTTNPSKTAQITSITPTSGKIGDTITIKGTNFGTTQNTSFVMFNSANVIDYLDWSGTEIKVKVPSSAISGKVSVYVDGTKSNEMDFKIIEIAIPHIKGINPISAKIDDEITISGENFGTTQGTSFVTLNNSKATKITIWCDSVIKVKLSAEATSGKISVTTNGVKSNDVDFIVITIETVTIGTQVWMLKNLDVDHYRNGDSIPQVTDSMDWKNLKTGAWCYYNNDPENGLIYGKIYNFYAVYDSRGLAPSGWHISKEGEWDKLEYFIGDTSNAGGKLKETGTLHWQSPNSGATNESGFTALPGGYRSYDGNFYNIGSDGKWWTDYYNKLDSCIGRTLKYNLRKLIHRSESQVSGFSVRCVKDK